MAEIILPEPGPHMLPKLEHPARHKILVCGRRWRKSTVALLAAIAGHGPDRIHKGALQGANIWWVTPAYQQATSAWHALRGTLQDVAEHISEANRRILLPGHGAITIKSAASIDSLVGDMRGIDGVVLDEAAKYDPAVWRQALSPAIADRKAWTIWPSTPEGLNYFYEIFQAVEDNPEWARWQEPSTANPFFDVAEIEARRREGVPDGELRREFYAEFVVLGPGRTYYEFSQSAHVRDVEYDRAMPLGLCVNFKVAPAAWLVVQGDVGRNIPERVIDEIMPEGDDRSVRAYLDEFRRRYPDHANGREVSLYGDASPALGGQSTGRSDYELVRKGLPACRDRVRSTVAAEKDRVNAVNNVLRDEAGRVQAVIDPVCHRTIRDLEGARNTDASYRVDHKTPGLGHYAHAWSCRLIWEYPMLAHRTREGEAADVPTTRRDGWPISTPEARRAYSKLDRAIRKGVVIKPKACEECHKSGYVEGAHTDYSRPLDVRWLCKRCHTLEDLKTPKGGTVASAARH